MKVEYIFETNKEGETELHRKRNNNSFLYRVVCSLFKKRKRCDHKEYYMDKQIRTLRCCECGKESWVKEYKNLYN
jgi:hypothetical protein